MRVVPNNVFFFSCNPTISNASQMASLCASDILRTDDLRNVFVRATRHQPWEHQLGAVEKLLESLKGDTEGMCRNFLVQHGAGSGKTWTMALLAWALRKVRGMNGRGFALVLMLSDRVELDRQLGASCNSFLEKTGVPLKDLRRCIASRDALTKILGDAAVGLHTDCLVVITTKQLFDDLSKSSSGHGAFNAILLRGRVAIICEEAHRSYFLGNKTSNTVNNLFNLHVPERMGTQQATQPPGISYIGFTATPDDRTLNFFGTRNDLGDKVQLTRPIHSYHVGKAEADGVVLDVVANYVRVEPLAGLADHARWILRDFKEKKALFHKPFHNQCQAMLICRSREFVVQYVHVLRDAARTSRGKRDAPIERVYGFFSGVMAETMNDEVRLNGGLLLPQACARADIIVVCKKLETGYDEPRLAVMYIDQQLNDSKQIVQVMSRLNRRAPAKHAAYVEPPLPPHRSPSQ